MEERKNLCAHIPVALHRKVRAEQEKKGMSLTDYITMVLTEYYEGGDRSMSGKMRTLAFQVPEELFQRVKAYLTGHGKMSQKEFVVGLIERAVSEWEAETISADSQDTDAGQTDNGDMGEESVQDDSADDGNFYEEEEAAAYEI